MRKLIYSLFVLVLGLGLFACEQEEITPAVEEPAELFTGDGGPDEDGGVKKS